MDVLSYGHGISVICVGHFIWISHIGLKFSIFFFRPGSVAYFVHNIYLDRPDFSVPLQVYNLNVTKELRLGCNMN